MKQKLCSVLTVLLAVILAVGGLPVTASATDYDTSRIQLLYHEQNAPEGTAYADLLIQMSDTETAYTKFAVKPSRRVPETVNGNTLYNYEPIGNITLDSGIVTYKNEGFVSLTLHCQAMKEFYQFDTEDGYQVFEIVLDSVNPYGDMADLADQFKKFKVAYVDKYGKVLSVTEEINVPSIPHTAYTFRANSDRLKLEKDIAGMTTMQLIVMIVSSVAVSVLIFFIVVLFVRKKLRQREAGKRYSKR